MNTLRVVCSACGTRMDCSAEDSGQTVLCRGCLAPVKVPLLDEFELENEEAAPRKCRDDFLERRATPGCGSPIIPGKVPAEPSTPVQVMDTDRALTLAALNIFRANNWPHTNEPDGRSFGAHIRFHNPQTNQSSVEDFRVFGEQHLLLIEALVLELPDLPDVPVLETLNEINERSVAAVFALTPSGVMMRHALLPRTREEGYFSAAMILQTLRQMNLDRRHALSLLETAVESECLDPLNVVQTYSHPLVPCALRSQSLEQVADMAVRAGFQVQKLPGQLVLSRKGAAEGRRAVRLAACPGFLRGWVVLGEPSPTLGTWRRERRS